MADTVTKSFDMPTVLRYVASVITRDGRAKAPGPTA